MKIVVKKDYVLKPLKEAFSEMDIVNHDEDGEILIADPEDCQKSYLDRMPSLQWIQIPRAGYDAVDMDYIRNRKIKLTSARGLYSIPIAEDIICKILMYTNSTVKTMKRQYNHEFKRNTDRFCLANMVVGFFGTGSIARETAKRLSPFGCTVIGYKRKHIDYIKYFDKLYFNDDFLVFLKQCDIVVLTSELNNETYHKINEQTISHMKYGSAIINVSRGAVIDEKALMKGLNEGYISFAGLDVFETEPLPENHPLWDMDNVIITSHSAGTCKENHAVFTDLVIENIKHFIDGKELINLI